ncbi:MAG: hypothetical protein IPO95_08505 [Rhodanobacteraceae bacterium]|nr:hypothetical protein [Rhodanobacteraceae bacterium]
MLSTQHAGEFLALTDGSDLNIQVRQEPWANSDTVAGITAIAVGAGTSRVEVRVRKALRVRVDGVDQPATGGFTQSALNAGAVFGVWRSQQAISTIAVIWADGSFVQVRPRDGWLDFSYQIAGLADGSKHLGLLGSADGDPGNDLRRRDGLIAEDTESGRAEFIESWRLRADESRFDYADGESTASFQIADFPRQHQAPDATALATASARCRAAGVENPAMIAACALDLAMTGNDDLLASHQAGANHLRRIAGARIHSTAIAAKPVGVSGPGFADATVILNNQLQSLRVGAGERRVFAIDVNQNDKLIAHAEPMECVDDYAGEGAGYQWFDANGKPRSVAKRSCSDLAGESVPPGRYFIVVTGPVTGSSVDVAFRPYLAQR